MIYRYFILIYCLCVYSHALGENKRIESFNQAKKILELDVYNVIPKVTVYCGAKFDKKEITDANGFYSEKFINRAKILEWEHIVPAENFGRAFTEWRDGHPSCVTNNGILFKGRDCASKVNSDYRYMESDVYNLFPAIGAVNALRSNLNFGAYASNKTPLGKCEMFFEGKNVVPPDRAKGIIARTYLYMEKTYRRYFNISSKDKKLFEIWDKKFPVTEDECKRAKLIQSRQININIILMDRCRAKGFW